MSVSSLCSFFKTISLAPIYYLEAHAPRAGTRRRTASSHGIWRQASKIPVARDVDVDVAVADCLTFQAGLYEAKMRWLRGVRIKWALTKTIIIDNFHIDDGEIGMPNEGAAVGMTYVAVDSASC